MFSLHGNSTPATILGGFGAAFAEDKKSKKPVQIFIDNRSAVDMGASFRDTQRTRHMMRRYHYVMEEVESNQHALIYKQCSGS